MTKGIQYITPSDVIEYLYCPRFIYFMHVLNIDQHEHRRYLVNKGRDMHDLKLVQNKDYLRKKIGVKNKLLDVYLSSETNRLVGKMDEVLFFEDGSAAPLDYKYAFWDDRVHKTHIYQQCLYCILIEENFDVASHKAFIVYIRSKNHLEALSIGEKLKKDAMNIVDEIFNIINLGLFPDAKINLRKCGDCTYRNVCVT